MAHLDSFTKVFLTPLSLISAKLLSGCLHFMHLRASTIVRGTATTQHIPTASADRGIMNGHVYSKDIHTLFYEVDPL